MTSRSSGQETSLGLSWPQHGPWLNAGPSRRGRHRQLQSAGGPGCGLARVFPSVGQCPARADAGSRASDTPPSRPRGQKVAVPGARCPRRRLAAHLATPTKALHVHRALHQLKTLQREHLRGHEQTRCHCCGQRGAGGGAGGDGAGGSAGGDGAGLVQDNHARRGGQAHALGRS